MSTQLPTEGTLELGNYILGYRWSSPFLQGKDVIFDASTRSVSCRVLFPGGIGYSTIKIPDHIHTVESLLKYLKKEGQFELKNDPNIIGRIGRLLRSIFRR